MQDMMTVWTHEGRKKRRKHYLVMHLREAHHIFYDLHTSPNKQKVIGFSKFCNLRPKNVLPTGDTPQYQSKCLIHENFFRRLEAMGQTTTGASSMVCGLRGVNYRRSFKRKKSMKYDTTNLSNTINLG